MRRVRHDPVFIDRGAEHVHRWRFNCSCGWFGVNRRRKKEAREAWTSHQRAVRRVPRTATFRRPVTPAADLPEILR